MLSPSLAQADPSPLDANIITEYGESETPRSAAMGGALRALGTGTTAIYQNPAALASARVYHIEALSQYTPETRRVVFGAAIVDSVTSRLAGSFSIMGTPIAMDPDGIRRSTLDLRLGLAFPITDRFIIGLTGRYLDVKQSGGAAPTFGFCNDAVSGGLVDTSSGAGPPRANLACPNHPDPNSGQLQDRNALVNAASFDAGLLVKPAETLAIAVIGQNLTYANNGFLPMLVGGGIGFGTDAFAIEVDGIADFSSWGVPHAAKPTARVGAGAEYKVAGIVPIRAGYKYDQGAKLSTVSLGSGYVGPQFAIELSAKRTVSNPGATTIFLSFAYYLESSGLTRPAEASQ
jgi:opacity protein-like surface antigen